jgi:hypothetical protein
VLKFLGDRWRGLAATLSLLLLISLAHAQVGSSSGAAVRKRMAVAVDRTLKEGAHAKLPPHLSTLLGLTEEKECPVVQGVVRTGSLVQGFDVSTADHKDVIIFAVSEPTNDQTLYLTSRDGALRKVVVVEQGVGRVQKITAEDRKGFEKERQFWLDRLAPLGTP